MTTIDRDALAQLLASVDLRVGVARRVTLDRSSLLPLPPGAVTLVYVAEGVVHGQPPLGSGCHLDVDRESRRIAVAPRGDRSQLAAGDAVLALGGQPLALEAERPAALVVVDLELSDAAAGLRAVLPDVVTVTDFAGLEPAAAALAENMGLGDPETCARRSGDPVICRMMNTTVLLSLIRAWAENGCAPEGWPANRRDPFLNRVVEAIHDQPGRDWTVELLANVGAMSRSVFAERFRSALGRSPASYVTEVRINTAKGMLERGLPVSTVARELGYSSDEGFSRAFRRHTGMTPSAWRYSRRPAVLA
jgi:AraC-like DNA-binding protein